MVTNDNTPTEEAKLINEHFFQWCALERRKLIGINDEISAPKNSTVHDDAPMACALLCWAMDKADDEKRELGLFKNTMHIPKPIFGASIVRRVDVPKMKTGFGM